jgi:hypothetical protein
MVSLDTSTDIFPHDHSQLPLAASIRLSPTVILTPSFVVYVSFSEVLAE